MHHNDAWLAGLFEGEGCVSATPYGGAILVIGMTDEDVVRAAMKIGGCGSICCQDGKPRVKPYYRWQVQKKSEVRALMARLRPYLFSRRQEKFDRIIAHMDAWKPKAKRKIPDRCIRGHEYTEENTRFRWRPARGLKRMYRVGRICRICKKEETRRRA